MQLKNKVKNQFAVTLFLISCLGGYVMGQTVKERRVQALEDITIKSTTIHIYLDPGQKRGSIEIPDSCLELLRDFPMSVSIPLGETFKTILPAGSTFFVPKGTYIIENSSDVPLKYLLKEAKKCDESPSKSTLKRSFEL